MIRCEMCGCNCDASDIRNGICDECQEELNKRADKKEKIRTMLNSSFEQLELEVLCNE